MAADLVQSSHAKEAVAANPNQPVISASPASAQHVVPPGVTGAFIAVGCAVRWLTERGPDPHNRERDHNEDRGHNNFAPHVATVTTNDVPMVAAVWQFGSLGCLSVHSPPVPTAAVRTAGSPGTVKVA